MKRKEEVTKSEKSWNVIRIFKVIWKFLTQDPKERTDEEWDEIFLVAEAIKETRELSEMRRRRKGRNIYAGRGMYGCRTRRK